MVPDAPEVAHIVRKEHHNVTTSKSLLLGRGRLHVNDKVDNMLVFDLFFMP